MKEGIKEVGDSDSCFASGLAFGLEALEVTDASIGLSSSFMANGMLPESKGAFSLCSCCPSVELLHPSLLIRAVCGSVLISFHGWRLSDLPEA